MQSGGSGLGGTVGNGLTLAATGLVAADGRFTLVMSENSDDRLSATAGTLNGSDMGEYGVSSGSWSSVTEPLGVDPGGIG